MYLVGFILQFYGSVMWKNIIAYSRGMQSVWFGFCTAVHVSYLRGVRSSADGSSIVLLKIAVFPVFVRWLDTV